MTPAPTTQLGPKTNHDSIRSHYRIRLGLAAGVLVSAFGGDLFAQAAPARFPEVRISFGSEAFDSEIPFDTQFRIVGEVGTDVDWTSVYYRESRTVAHPPPCPVGWEGRASDLDAAQFSRTPIWIGPFRWSRTSSAETEMKVQVETAAKARKRYVFWTCLVGVPSDEVRTAFRGRARTVIDGFLLNTKAEFIPDAAVRQLRSDLCVSLKALTGRGQVFAGDSLFDCDSPAKDDAIAAFTLLLADTLAPQRNAESSLAVYVSTGSTNPTLPEQLQRSIDALRAETSPLHVINAALQVTTNPVYRDLAQRNDTAFGLGALTAQKATEVAFGRGPVKAVANPLQARSDATVALDVSKNYERTLQDFDALRRSLLLLIGTDDTIDAFQRSLPPAAQLSPATIAAARTLIDQTQLVDPCAVATLRAVVCGISTSGRLMNAFVVAGQSAGQRAAALDEAIQHVDLQLIQVRIANATTVPNADTARAMYVSSDAGVLAAPAISEASTYIAANLYLRPINTRAALADFGGFWRRFALTFGIALNSVADTDQTRFNLFSSQNVVAGGGFRITEALRVSAGTLIFRKADPNPFRRERPATWSPYVSFSLDVGLALHTRGIQELFPQ